MVRSRVRGRRLIGAAALLCLPHVASAQALQSSALVKELTTAMAARQLDTIAAADPARPGRFVAALLLPGVQLLVVAAEYPNAAELQSLIAQRSYRDVYSALHQPLTQTSRVFFLDAGCDGLRTGSDAVDVMYDKGTTETLFDGNWKKSGLSEAAYFKRVQEADGQFKELVSVLRSTLAPEIAGAAPAK
jgi:hypothetical protein